MQHKTVRKCLIIAAGQGSRLIEMGQPKPLIKLGNMTLLERVIALNREVDISEFYVVTGFQREKIDTYLQNLAKSLRIKVQCIYNPDWQRENGLSVLTARDFLKEPFFLMMADHIFDTDILRILKDHPPQQGEAVLAVDFRVRDNPQVDLEDVTKVWVEGSRLKAIGKNLERYNGFDTGLFFCTPVVFKALEESSTMNNDTSLSGGIRQLAGREKVGVVDIGNRFWIDVDDPAAFVKAQKLVVSQNVT